MQGVKVSKTRQKTLARSEDLQAYRQTDRQASDSSACRWRLSYNEDRLGTRIACLPTWGRCWRNWPIARTVPEAVTLRTEGAGPHCDPWSAERTFWLIYWPLVWASSSGWLEISGLSSFLSPHCVRNVGTNMNSFLSGRYKFFNGLITLELFCDLHTTQWSELIHTRNIFSVERCPLQREIGDYSCCK
jgi:hypothetical protein